MQSATIARRDIVEPETTTEAVPVFGKILVAVDQFDADLSAVKLAADIGARSGAAIRVLHVREREVYFPRTFILETPAEAQSLVDLAVGDLRRAGLEADGTVGTALVDRTWLAILQEAASFGANAIVIGSPTRRRIFGSRTREHLLRKSSIPVLVAPKPSVGVTESRAPRPGQRATRRAA
jgi:nucleotide-binding universal stress UspA family protein